MNLNNSNYAMANTEPAEFRREAAEQTGAMPSYIEGRKSAEVFNSLRTSTDIEPVGHNDGNTVAKTELPSIVRFFDECNKKNIVINNCLVLDKNDPKRNLTREQMSEIYDELGNTDSIRINPDSMKISHLKKWQVICGEGIISVNGRLLGFVYGASMQNPVQFKARVGFSQKLKSTVCIVKANGNFYVSDFISFRGHCVSQKKGITNTVGLIYSARYNVFDFNFTAERPSARVMDFNFRMLLVVLMNGITEESKVILNAILNGTKPGLQ